jgi:hypothetical protein
MNPWVKNPSAAKNPGPYREGDRVTFRFGTADAEGTVVEDRGNLGVGGRRLYGIVFRLDDVSEELYVELPPEDLRALPVNSGDGSAE